MTCDSIASRPIRFSRPSSRSTSLRTAVGSSSFFSRASSSSTSLAVVALAELLLDRLHLLAQQHLALAVAQLLAHSRLDVLLGVEHRELALDVHQHPPQALLDGERLEQRLAFGGGNLDVRGDQVGEAAGLGRVRDHLRATLLRQSGLLRQLERALAGLAHQRHEGGVARIGRRLLGRRQGGRLEIAVPLLDSYRDAAALALEHELQPGEGALHLSDAGDGADGVEPLRAHLVDVLALGEDEDERLGGASRGLDRLEGTGPAGADRHRQPRKEDGVAQRQDGKEEMFAHAPLNSARAALIPESSASDAQIPRQSSRPPTSAPMTTTATRARRGPIQRPKRAPP